MAAVIANLCDILALVRKEPRSTSEVTAITGFRRETVKRFLDALRAEGHVRIEEWRRPTGRGRPTPVYAWQMTVYEKPDAIYARER